MKKLFDNNNRSHFKITEDWVFKYMYGAGTPDSDKALIALLNTVLGRREEPITSVKVLNPISLDNVAFVHGVIMDILAITSLGDSIEIEMQSGHYKGFKERVLYNGAKMLNSALEKGKDYDKIKTCIVISFVSDVLFKDIEQCHTVFHVREDKHHVLMSNRISWHFIELGKINEAMKPGDMTPVEKLAAYMKYAGDIRKEEYIEELLESGEEAISMSENVFIKVTDDMRAMALQNSRELYELEQMIKKNEYIDEGKIETKKEVASKMKAEGFSDDLISKITGLDRKEIEGIEEI